MSEPDSQNPCPESGEQLEPALGEQATCTGPETPDDAGAGKPARKRKKAKIDKRGTYGEDKLPPTHVTDGFRSAARRHIATWAAMRAGEPGLSTRKAAERLGLTYGTLRAYITRARKEGWLTFDDPIDKVEYELIPKIVDNLNYWLELKDKKVTVEAAKGTLFPMYQAAKGIQQETTQTVLALKIESPAGDTVQIVTGEIVGTPRKIDDNEPSA